MKQLKNNFSLGEKKNSCQQVTFIFMFSLKPLRNWVVEGWVGVKTSFLDRSRFGLFLTRLKLRQSPTLGCGDKIEIWRKFSVTSKFAYNFSQSKNWGVKMSFLKRSRFSGFPTLFFFRFFVQPMPTSDPIEVTPIFGFRRLRRRWSRPQNGVKIGFLLLQTALA